MSAPDISEEAAAEIRVEGKPSLPIDGIDGNAYAVLGAVKTCLRRNQMPACVADFRVKMDLVHSYDEVLQLCMSYVDFE